MRYASYQYLTPPRAESKVQPGLLPYYEQRGWTAQVKKNGTCSTIYVPPKGTGQDPFAKTRHEDDPEHKAWRFTEHSIRQFRALQGSDWFVFVAELMHSKGNGIRDTNYVHDILVCEGQFMLGSSFHNRQKILHEIFKTSILKGPVSHHVVDDHTWVARNHSNGFRALFDSCEKEDEGLVLKKPTGRLSLRDGLNSSWMVKSRRPHENYGH